MNKKEILPDAEKKMRKEVLVEMLFCTAILFLCAFISSASASTLYVPDDHSTIQAAVDAASDGDTIIVRDGTYVENVDVNKSVTIKSENGAEVTIIQAANLSDSVLEVFSDYVNINGFMVKGAGGMYYFAGIYLFNADHCAVSDNIIMLNKYNIGINLDSSSNNTLANNTASNNSNGIMLRSSSNNVITDNIASNNYIGINLDSSSNNTLTNNIASNNDITGIHLESSSYNAITNNTASSNGRDGIFLESSSYNAITNNTASSNYAAIYLYSSSNNMLTGNIVSNNANGVDLRYSSNNTIFLNTFTDNTDSIYDYSYHSTNIWNSTSEITYTYKGKTHKNYLGNYWDDYTGSDADRDGIGDTPYSIDSDHHDYPLSDADDYPLMETWKNYFTEITPITPITPEEKPEIPTGEEKGVPGFEVLFALAGLLAIAYILRRCRK